MRTFRCMACVLSVAAIMLAGCDQSDEGGDGTGLLLLLSSNDSIAQMSQSSLEAVSEGMSDINNSGALDLSYRMPCSGGLFERMSLREGLVMAEGKILEAISAEAATITCPGGGTVDVTDIAGTWGNSAASSYYVARTFNDCKGPYGLVTVSGSGLINWSFMQTGTTGVLKLKNGSIMEQAPVNKRFTRGLTGAYITTEGNGGPLTDGTLAGNVAHTIYWTAVGADTRSFTMDVDLTRRGYSGTGTQVFEHTLTTPAPLAVTVDMTADTRTLSGTIEVDHALLGMTVSTTFSNLVVPINDCVPSSGGATIVITGLATGDGTITYNGDGTADYTYTYATPGGRTRSGSGSFTVSGCQ